MLQHNVLRKIVQPGFACRVFLLLACFASSLSAKTDVAASLSISPPGGVYPSNVLVVLKGAAKEIRYTLDGSEPATNSPLYKSPLHLTNSVLLQARGFSPDWKESFRLTETYTLLETNSQFFTSSLPLVVISTFGHAVSGSNIAASIRFINTNGAKLATLTGTPDFDGRINIKTRGYTSLRYPKKSYSVETRDAEGNSEPVSILGMPKETDWVLYAPYPDKSLIRDVLAYELSRKLGHYAPRTQFVELFLNDSTNRMSRSNYAGIYVLEEKVKRGEHRVALAKLSTHDETPATITGGYIFKKDHLEELAEEAAAAEAPTRTRGILMRGKFPTGPGAFPADPAAFPQPDPAFTNAISITTNIVSLTNLVASTNFIVSALGVTVVSTNVSVVTTTHSITNTVVTTNLVVSTNRIVGTNAIVSSKTVIATNPVVNTAAVSGTNTVATTNAVDPHTAVITTTMAITTSTTYRTNLVVITNLVASTNFVGFTNLVAVTNPVIATNVSIATSTEVSTNILKTTNLFLLSSQRPVLLEKLVTSGKGFVTSHTNAFFYVDLKPKHITEAQRNWLFEYLNQFEHTLYSSNFRNPTNGYTAYIDTDSFIDQHLFVEATKNIDGFRFSTFFTKDRGGKIKMEPIWDSNLIFGLARGKQGYMYDRWYWPQLDDQQYSWFRRLFEDPDFGQRYVDRWAQWRTNVFAASNLLTRIDQLAAALKEPAARNFTRWPILGEVVDPEHYAGKTYDDEITYMKTWITNRLDWMTAQFITPPILSTPTNSAAASNSLLLTASSGEIYFTTDGSDPRAAGGSVAPAAALYKGPIPASGATSIIVARARKDSRWSSPTTIRVVLTKPALPAGG